MTNNVIERPQVVALAMPGEYFHNLWVVYMLHLYQHLLRRFHLQPILSYSSAVYMTRHDIARAVLDEKPPAEFVLWIDDDNLLTIEQFEKLWALLEYRRDVQMVAAWTVATVDAADARPRVSCGPAAGEPEWTLAEMSGPPREAAWTGFPAVLMRREALEMAGKYPFAPIPIDGERGALGEDVSFCRRLIDAGGKILVDPEVAVPHLKLRNVLPGGALRAREVNVA